MTKRRAGMTKRRARSDSLFYLSWNECEASHKKALNSSSNIFEHPRERGVCRGYWVVEITGGEPLLQEGTPLLVEEILSRGYKVLVETNGSLNIDLVSKEAVRIVDFKCPSSGMVDRNNYDNIMRLRPNHDEVKFVIGDQEDYRFAKRLREKILESGWQGVINFSPVFGELDPAELASWILRDRLDVRLNLQLHKYIWKNVERGV
jgi:7-carboxy-7-deazaguanine synthase